jgi:HP0268
MQLKLAREELGKEPKAIDADKLLEEMLESKPCIRYLDKTNVGKDMVTFAEKVEKAKANVYLREVKFGLDPEEFMYEVHVL